MKNCLLVILFLLAVAGGASTGATYLFGSHTSNWIMSEMDKLRQQSGTADQIEINQTSYTRGYLKSEATTSVRMAGGAQGIQLKHVIYHGPVAMTPDGIKIGSNYMVTTIDRDGFPKEFNDILDKGFKGKEPMRLAINGGFAKSIDVAVEIPPFSLNAADLGAKGQIEFGGLTGSYNLSKTRGSASIESGKLRVEGADASGPFLFEMEPATIKSDMRQIIEGVVVVEGDGKTHFPGMAFSQGGQNFQIRDLAMTSRIEPGSNTQIEGDLELSLGEARLPAGTGLDAIRPIIAGGCRLKVEFGGIDIETLSILPEAQKRLQVAQAEVMETQGSSREAMNRLQKEATTFMKTVVNLIRKDLVVILSASSGEGAGKSKVALGLKFTGEGKATDWKTIAHLIRSITGQAVLRLDKSLVPPEQSAQLAQPVSQGIILDKGTHYEAQIKLSNGTLDLNGKSMSLLDQLGHTANDPVPFPWRR